MSSAPDPDGLPPWDKPGSVRRDCEPHRGGVLLTLALAALMLNLFSLALGIPCAIVVGDLLDLPGLPAPDRGFLFLGIILPGILAGTGAWWVAHRDLTEMTQGRRDPDGESLTRSAGSYGRAGLVLAGVALTFWAICTLVILVVRPAR